MYFKPANTIPAKPKPKPEKQEPKWEDPSQGNVPSGIENRNAPVFQLGHREWAVDVAFFSNRLETLRSVVAFTTVFKVLTDAGNQPQYYPSSNLADVDNSNIRQHSRHYIKVIPLRPDYSDLLCNLFIRLLVASAVRMFPMELPASKLTTPDVRSDGFKSICTGKDEGWKSKPIVAVDSPGTFRMEDCFQCYEEDEGKVIILTVYQFCPLIEGKNGLHRTKKFWSHEGENPKIFNSMNEWPLWLQTKEMTNGRNDRFSTEEEKSAIALEIKFEKDSSSGLFVEKSENFKETKIRISAPLNNPQIEMFLWEKKAEELSLEEQVEPKNEKKEDKSVGLGLRYALRHAWPALLTTLDLAHNLTASMAASLKEEDDQSPVKVCNGSGKPSYSGCGSLQKMPRQFESADVTGIVALFSKKLFEKLQNCYEGKMYVGRHDLVGDQDAAKHALEARPEGLSGNEVLVYKSVLPAFAHFTKTKYTIPKQECLLTNDVKRRFNTGTAACRRCSGLIAQLQLRRLLSPGDAAEQQHDVQWHTDARSAAEKAANQVDTEEEANETNSFKAKRESKEFQEHCKKYGKGFTVAYIIGLPPQTNTAATEKDEKKDEQQPAENATDDKDPVCTIFCPALGMKEVPITLLKRANVKLELLNMFWIDFIYLDPKPSASTPASDPNGALAIVFENHFQLNNLYRDENRMLSLAKNIFLKGCCWAADSVELVYKNDLVTQEGKERFKRATKLLESWAACATMTSKFAKCAKCGEVIELFPEEQGDDEKKKLPRNCKKCEES